MKILKQSIISFCVVLSVACNNEQSSTQNTTTQSKTQSEESQSSGELIPVEKAKEMIAWFRDSYRTENNGEEPTIAVHYTKEDFVKLFNQSSFISFKSFQEVKYDGVRIYFAKYNKATTSRTENVNKNTLVLVLTRLSKGGIYEDFSGMKEVTVLPLNDGSRCKPNCQGVTMIDIK